VPQPLAQETNCHYQGIQFDYVPTNVPVVTPFPNSPVVPQCSKQIQEYPQAFFFEPYYDDDDDSMDTLVQLLRPKTPTTTPIEGNNHNHKDYYDYVILNVFSHYSKVVKAMRPCYKKQIVALRKRQQSGFSNTTTSTSTSATVVSFRHVMMQELLEYYQQQLKLIGDLMSEHYPQTRFYYRTSPPHVYNWTTTTTGPRPPPAMRIQPLIYVPELLQNASFSHEWCFEHHSKYLWACSDRMNAMAMDVVVSNTSNSNSNSHINHLDSVLDAAPAMSLRVDAHPCSFTPHKYGSEGDCLHFCMPGPPDTMLQAIQVEVWAREWDDYHDHHYYNNDKNKDNEQQKEEAAEEEYDPNSIMQLLLDGSDTNTVMQMSIILLLLALVVVVVVVVIGAVGCCCVQARRRRRPPGENGRCAGRCGRSVASNNNNNRVVPGLRGPVQYQTVTFWNVGF
jgi:hypothetical protein